MLSTAGGEGQTDVDTGFLLSDNVDSDIGYGVDDLEADVGESSLLLSS